MRKNLTILYFFINFIVVLSMEPILETLSEKATKKNFPNAHEVLLKREEKIEYVEDGNYQRTKEEYFKILDQIGKEQNKVVYRSYNSQYSEKKILEIKVIRSGEVLQFDLKKGIHLQHNPSGQESNIYDENKKLLSFNLSDLQIGDLVYIKEYEKSKKTRVPGNYTAYIGGQEFYPIMYSSTEIIGPASKPLRTFKVYNGVEGSYTLENGESQEKNWYRFKIFDVPQINPEPQMPNIIEIGMRLAAGTASSWEEIAQWYYNISEPKIVIDPHVREAAQRIAGSCENDVDRVRAVFFWVSRNIRYMGVNIGGDRPGLEPNTSTYTLKNMTGVCRDKAALIVAMLRSLGYESYMVLMNASRQMEEDFPNSFFNHAIAGVNLNGSFLLMDPTDETTKTLMPEYLSGKPYLVVKKGGAGISINEVADPESNSVSIMNEMAYENGDLLVKSRLKFYGMNDNAYRKYLLGLKEDERERFFKGLIKGLGENTELLKFSVRPENLLDEQVMELELKFRIKDFVVGDTYMMLKIPQISDIIGMHNWMLEDFGLSDRKYPLIMDSTISFEEETKIAINGVDFLNLPEDISKTNNSFDFFRGYSSDKTGLNLHTKFSLKKIQYSTDDYYEVRKLIGDIENYDKKYIIMQKW